MPTSAPHVFPSWQRCLLVYVGLCVVRVANVAVIQSYFDPDEFWQTLEPAYCTVWNTKNSTSGLSNCAGHTWEWKRRAPSVSPVCRVNETSHGDSATCPASSSTAFTSPSLQRLQWIVPQWLLDWINQCLQGPARTYLSVVPTALLYRVLYTLGLDTPWAVARGPMILNALSIAAPIDWIIWFVATLVTSTVATATDKASTLPWWCLACSVTAWFHAYTLVRSLANGQESLLLSGAIALVLPELLDSIKDASSTTPTGSKDASFTPTTKSTSFNLPYPWLRAVMAFYLGGCSTAIRCTAVVAFVPLGHVLAVRSSRSHRGMSTRSFLHYALYLLAPCALGGALGIATGILVDYYYFGIVTIPFLGNLHFNVVMNAAHWYGAHPWHWYYTAGLPAISGVLVPFCLVDLVGYQLPCLVRRRPHDTWTRFCGILWSIIGVYVGALSLNAHKEFRYILPVLPLLCWIASRHVRTLFGVMGQGYVGRVFQGSLGTIWIGANLVAVLYLGLFHQSAPIAVHRELVRRDVQYRSWNSEPNVAPVVHYWTGACHSTPLHSHLHRHAHQFNRSIRLPPFETWHLDCSPHCRNPSNVGLVCESVQFDRDPVAFVRQAYCLDRNTTCQPTHPRPNYVVTFAKYVTPELTKILQSLRFRMSPVACFPHALTGFQMVPSPTLEPAVWHNVWNTVSSQCGPRLLLNRVELNVDEMVLFAVDYSEYELMDINWGYHGPPPDW